MTRADAARRATRRRGTWLTASAAAVIVVAMAALLGRGTATPQPSPGSGGPTGLPAGAAPVVFYEVLDARASVLMERRLDGQSLPRRVAARSDAGTGRTWAVDPTATVAISNAIDGSTSHLVAVSVADGGTAWSTDVPAIDLYPVAWSADGRRLAAIASPENAGHDEALVVDTRDGRVTRTTVPDGAALQGFDTDDALILRIRLDPGGTGHPSWRFLRVDPASNVIEQLTAPPAVGPGSAGGSDDADPAHDIAVTTATTSKDGGTPLQAWSLSADSGRTIASFRSIGPLAIDPAGSGVAVVTGTTVRFVGWDGAAAELWSGEGTPVDVSWSSDGAFVGVVAVDPDPSLTIVERATGRTVTLPPLGSAAEAAIVRIVGGAPLPAAPLPAVEPSPTPTPSPSGDDVGEAIPIASGWVERVDGRWRLHAERLVPTASGGLRIAASMPPVDAGPASAEPNDVPGVRLLPRPGGADLLVWFEAADGSASVGFLWDGSGSARPIGLPHDWPRNALDPHWSPDGSRLAASAERLDTNGDVVSTFVVAAPGAARTTVIPVPEDYTMLEGWWSASDLRVGHAVCTEGCPGRHAWSARLRVRDAHLTQLTAADRARGAVDSVYPDGHGGLVLSVANEDPADDIHVDWPLGDDPDGPLFVRFVGGERTLVAASETHDETDLYRIDDILGRLVANRLADPRPTLLGHLGPHLTDIRVSADLGWAITTDRVGDVSLTELQGGRTWPLDRDRTSEWWPTS